MFPYIPTTETEREHMLKAIGVNSVDDLFADIPEEIRLNRALNLENSKSEYAVKKYIGALGAKNQSTEEFVSFLGAGAYDHYIPSAVSHITGRSEFYTAYTPYQPEISQGTLQSIYEYQTMICELTGMEASNASIYDGPTATAEAAMISTEKKRGNIILVSKTVHPDVREVVSTYMKFRDVKVVEIPEKNGITDVKAFEELISKDCAAVIVQSPNFYGNLEDISDFVEGAKENKALSIFYTDPIGLGILKTPGEYGVDIAVGEAQALGNTMSFGGPYLGFIAVSKKHVRKLPGRIVGLTKDTEGRAAYVLTLQAREQHIRREKASSNICSNQALNALAATVYASLMGKRGLEQVALESHKRAVYLRKRLLDTGLFEAPFDQPFFKEFVLKSKKDLCTILKSLKEGGILGGLDIANMTELGAGHLLISVTEKRTKEEMDRYVQIVEGM